MADILIAPGSTMPNAPAGEVTLFIDTENNNILSYIDQNGIIKIYNGGNPSELEECCSCEIAKKWMGAITCALKNGTLSATEYGTLTNAGLSVTSTETINPDTGAKTCTVEIGPKAVNPIAVTSIVVTVAPPGGELVVSGTSQMAAAILPVNATNQNLIWVSGNPARATVNASGLVTGISTGTVIIYAYSQSNPTVFGSITLTVNP